MGGIFFLGSGSLGSAALRSLLTARLPVVAAFDARRSDGEETDANQHSVTLLARQAELPVLNAPNLNRGEALAALVRYRPDVLVVASCPYILKPHALAAAGVAINVHPSLLPKYRGPNPLFWVLRNAEPTTGVTLHLMTAGVDSGPVLWQEPVPVTPGESGEELLTRTLQVVEQHTGDVIRRYLAGGLEPVPQQEAEATHQGNPTWQDVQVDLNWSCRRIYAFVRGVRQWVPLYLRMGDLLVEITDAALTGEGERPPDSLPPYAGPGWVEAQAGSSVLQLHLGNRMEVP
ncbi:MAG: methionyl-tRNA formyltransferase [Bacillota bacterium]